MNKAFRAIGKFIILLVITIVILSVIAFTPIIGIDGQVQNELKNVSEIKIMLGAYEGSGNADLSKFSGKIINDRALIEELANALKSNRNSLLGMGYCVCSGYPIIVINDKVSISVHHEKSIRVTGGGSNYYLSDVEKIKNWMTKIGLPLDKDARKLKS